MELKRCWMSKPAVHTLASKILNGLDLLIHLILTYICLPCFLVIMVLLPCSLLGLLLSLLSLSHVIIGDINRMPLLCPVPLITHIEMTRVHARSDIATMH